MKILNLQLRSIITGKANRDLIIRRQICQKADVIEIEGKVVEKLPNAFF